MKFEIYTDGGARGNPGPAAYGFLIFNSKGELIASHKKYLGVATNNVAEYQAIIASLEEAKRRGAQEVASFMDSELACRQLQGKYKVRQPHLQALHTKVRHLEASFKKITYTHVRRENEKIQMADALVNDALDEAQWKR
jgi:ribonuclease HI